MEVERAKTAGRWDVAYDSPSTAQVPADLTLALSRNPKAKASFVALNAVDRPGQLRTQRPVGALASILLVIQTPSISSGRFHVDGRSNAHGWIV